MPKSEGGDKRRPEPKKLRLTPARWGKSHRDVKVSDLMTPNPLVPISRAVLVNGAGLAALSVVATGAASGGWIVAAGALLLGWAILPFGYRGLENMVHGAAHKDLSADVELNDRWADGFIARPVFQSTAAFREPHLIRHHGNFAGDDDPCRARMERHEDVQAGRLPSILGTLRAVPRETKEFYKTVGGNPKDLALGLAWHAAFLIAPAALISGSAAAAVLAWLAVFAPVFLVLLPLVRAFAETGEHDYSNLDQAPDSMVERTFDKTGVINSLFHPFGDGWHVGHHLYPGVPQYRLATLMKRLLAKGFGADIKRRTSLLGEPTPYGPPPPANDNAEMPTNDNAPRRPQQPAAND